MAVPKSIKSIVEAVWDNEISNGHRYIPRATGVGYGSAKERVLTWDIWDRKSQKFIININAIKAIDPTEKMGN